MVAGHSIIKADRHPFCNLLRSARVRRGLSLVEAAVSMGVESVTLGSWERNDREPSLGRFCQWAQAMGYEVTLLPLSEQDRTEDQNAFVEWRVRSPSGVSLAATTEAKADQLAAVVQGAVKERRVVLVSQWGAATGSGD